LENRRDEKNIFSSLLFVFTCQKEPHYSIAALAAVIVLPGSTARSPAAKPSGARGDEALARKERDEEVLFSFFCYSVVKRTAL